MTLLFLRTVLLYICVICGLRLSGKRQLGELSTSEFAVTILVSELASIPLQDTAVPMVNGVVPLFTLVSLEILTGALCQKSRRFRHLLSGNPCIIIRDGTLDTHMLRELRLSIDEVMEALRLAGTPNISDIRYAIVETNGQLSVLPKADMQPLTPTDLHLRPPEQGIPLILITCGTVVTENLRRLGKTEQWLSEQCRAHGVSSLDKVYLFTLDDCGNQFIQTRCAEETP